MTEEIVEIDMKSSNSLNIFFFGCWNRDACINKNQNTELKYVVDKIKESSWDFGIIAGDNVYPKKDKQAGTKTYSVQKLKDGIDCILGINKPLYVALGNHDIYNCDILNHQLNFKHDLWKIAKYYGIRYKLENFNVLFLFIDTNLYEKKKKKKKKGKLTCYESGQPIPISDSESGSGSESEPENPHHIDDIISSRSKMENWLIKNINENKNLAKHIFIVGHEPLYALKKKDNKIIGYRDTFNPLIKKLFETKTNLNYLCADIHNFQELDLAHDENRIKIIASGTGGAKPDDLVIPDALRTEFKNNYIKEESFDDIKYQMNFIQQKESYGYTGITINDQGLEFKYEKVDIPEQTGGFDYLRYVVLKN